MSSNHRFLSRPFDVDVSLTSKRARHQAAGALFGYCASANIPPARECQAAVMLIGQFRSFTATSARPP
jgi:hypothetical protein